jgi:hypothetical protein
MYISYGLAVALIVVIGVALWTLTRWRIDKVTIWAIVLFLPFAPVLTFLARVLWIYFDQAVDQERRQAQGSDVASLGRLHRLRFWRGI